MYVHELFLYPVRFFIGFLGLRQFQVDPEVILLTLETAKKFWKKQTRLVLDSKQHQVMAIFATH